MKQITECQICLVIIILGNNFEKSLNFVLAFLGVKWVVSVHDAVCIVAQFLEHVLPKHVT